MPNVLHNLPPPRPANPGALRFLAMSTVPDGSDGGPFWSVFEASRIPMALIDRDLRFVAVNDAALALYQYTREDVIGQPAGTAFVGGRSSTGADEWQKLLRDNELYGERVIAHPSGQPMRVSYAAHATTIDGQWRALFVTLSAKIEPSGSDLPCQPRRGIRTAYLSARSRCCGCSRRGRPIGRSPRRWC